MYRFVLILICLGVNMTSYGQQSLYERVMGRQSQLESKRTPWDSQRQAIAEAFRADLTDESLTGIDEGAFRGEDIIEGSGPYAAGVMARCFQGSLCGPSINWIRHVTSQLELKGNDVLNKWLQDFDDHMRATYRKSNFYDVMPSYTLDGVTVGTPVVIIEEDVNNGINICTVPHYTENYLWLDWQL